MQNANNKQKGAILERVDDGISRGRMNVNWFGETQPKFDNSTAEGRAKNRRVNIAILPNDRMIENVKKETGN